tara:strand:+ start:3374 stop:3640 length:267 start_codon:yes stop_codon:yes gene_type:complete
MKIILRVLFVLILLFLITGYYIKSIEENEIFGEKILGITVLFSVMIFLPVFLYHRWKDKDIRNYMLTKENFDRIKKMNEKKKSNKFLK